MDKTKEKLLKDIIKKFEGNYTIKTIKKNTVTITGSYDIFTSGFLIVLFEYGFKNFSLQDKELTLWV